MYDVFDAFTKIIANTIRYDICYAVIMKLRPIT